MQLTGFRWMFQFFYITVASFIIVILLNKDVLIAPFLENAQLQSFKTIFISIMLEAIPFILLGVFISSFLHVFVSEKVIQRFIPRNPVLGILFACVLGFLFPICECGMIPVVRRLMLKGMPLYMAVVFIFAGPVLNPIVFTSTYMAFRSQPEMAYSRMGLAFTVAALLGFIIYRFVRNRDQLRISAAGNFIHTAAAHHHRNETDHQHHDHGHTHYHSNHQTSDHHHQHDHYAHDHQHGHSGNKFTHMLDHASNEFIDMGKYLIFGALMTAAVQTLVAREQLVSIGQSEWSSHLFMMGFAYILSLCSTSDAFVASSFMTLFTKGSILSFLVFGPMLDFKTTLMLLSIFKARFVLLLGLLVAGTVLAGSFLFEQYLL